MKRFGIEHGLWWVVLALGASMGAACGPLPPAGPLAKPAVSASPASPTAVESSSGPGTPSEEGPAPEASNPPQAVASPGASALPEASPSPGPSSPPLPPSGGISGPAQPAAAPPLLEDGPTPTDPTVEVDLGASAPEDGRWMNPQGPIEGRAQ